MKMSVSKRFARAAADSVVSPRGLARSVAFGLDLGFGFALGKADPILGKANFALGLAFGIGASAALPLNMKTMV